MGDARAGLGAPRVIYARSGRERKGREVRASCLCPQRDQRLAAQRRTCARHAAVYVHYQMLSPGTIGHDLGVLQGFVCRPSPIPVPETAPAQTDWIASVTGRLGLDLGSRDALC
jgi:hypothetical protein